MELIRGRHNLRPRHRGCALAIGNFDGVHRGHQELLARARREALAAGVQAAVLSFEPMPREFFKPEDAPRRITELRDKLCRFARADMDRAVILRFDRTLSGMAAQDFVEHLLFEQLGATHVVVGSDFRYGARRSGDVNLLRSLGAARGVAVDIVEPVLSGEERCSSTAVREALAEAALDRVASMLGRPYTIIGRVRHGLKLGRKLGLPTTNIMFHRTPALRFGVYAVRVRDTAGGDWIPGVANVGARPTIGGTRPLLESHLFDNEDDWYGREQEVEFRRFLRDQQKFPSLDALAAQMQRDADAARALLL